jgi:hypothetical protein
MLVTTLTILLPVVVVALVVVAVLAVRQQLVAAETRGIETGRRERLRESESERTSREPDGTETAELERLKAEIVRKDAVAEQLRAQLATTTAEVARSTAERRQLAERRESLEQNLDHLKEELDRKRSRTSLIEDGWLPLHPSCRPDPGEQILVGGLDAADVLLTNDLGLAHAVFRGAADGNAQLGNGAGSGLAVADDGSLLWMSLARWQLVTDRKRMMQAIDRLAVSTGERIAEPGADGRVGPVRRLRAVEHRAEDRPDADARSEPGRLQQRIDELESRLANLESGRDTIDRGGGEPPR